MTARRSHRPVTAFCGLVIAFLGAAAPAAAQDLEPRRWSHLPTGINYAGAMYAYTKANVLFDPVLELDDVTLDLHAVAAKYVRTFELLSHSARMEIAVPWQDAHWEGLLQGEPASAQRTGFADPIARFAVNFLGAPPMKGPEFAQYRAAHPVDTTAGAALAVQAPLGEYDETKLLNLGENRLVLRSDLGVEHTHGKWLSEVTGSVLVFTDNDEFWNGNTREQDPFYALQGHLSYIFRPGLWMSGGVGYGFGGESMVNGIPKNDQKGNLVAGLSVGVPINPSMGLKFAYIRNETHEDTGSDSDTLSTAISMTW
jgi:hypothetical protein